MNVICLQEEAFYALVDKVTKYITEKHGPKLERWVSGEEVMKMLRITSKTTLQKLRDEGRITYSQPEKKIILYDVDSIHEYLDKHARKPF